MASHCPLVGLSGSSSFAGRFGQDTTFSPLPRGKDEHTTHQLVLVFNFSAEKPTILTADLVPVWQSEMKASRRWPLSTGCGLNGQRPNHLLQFQSRTVNVMKAVATPNCSELHKPLYWSNELVSYDHVLFLKKRFFGPCCDLDINLIRYPKRFYCSTTLSAQRRVSKQTNR